MIETQILYTPNIMNKLICAILIVAFLHEMVVAEGSPNAEDDKRNEEFSKCKIFILDILRFLTSLWFG